MTEKEQYKQQLKQQALKAGTILQQGRYPYKVLAVLGAGGFGITYKVSAKIMVEHVPVTVYFAMKEYFYKSCWRADDGKTVTSAPTMQQEVGESRQDFLTEAKRLNRLSGTSRNIVRVNEVFEENNTVYYVMEYLDGGDLQTYVQRNGVMDEHTAIDILGPIMEAVVKLHDEHVLHLDIKPDNIVLKQDPDTQQMIPVLIDFGVAKHFDKGGKPTSNKIAKGASAGYAPIEQYAEIDHFMPELDVYALGATLLYLLTGKQPPKAYDINPAVLLRLMPESVSNATRDAILHAMNYTRAERTPNVRKMMNELQVRTDNSRGTVRIKPLPPDPNPKPWMKYALTGGASAIAVMLLVWAFSGSGNKEAVPTPETAVVEDTTPEKPEVGKPAEPVVKTVEKDSLKDDYGSYLYTGPVNADGQPHGEGKAEYLDADRKGSVYTGHFEAGRRVDSQALFVYADGSKFEGSFIDDHFGEGTYTDHKTGDYFKGSFKNFQPYKGQWYDKNGKKLEAVKNRNSYLTTLINTNK